MNRLHQTFVLLFSWVGPVNAAPPECGPGGAPDACRRAVDALNLPNGPEAAALYGRACAMGDAESCGSAAWSGLSPTSDVVETTAQLRYACDRGDALYCRLAAAVWATSPTGHPDAALGYARRGCEREPGRPSCWLAAQLGYFAGVVTAEELQRSHWMEDFVPPVPGNLTELDFPEAQWVAAAMGQTSVEYRGLTGGGPAAVTAPSVPNPR
jgi:hypothetical protein